MHIGHEKDDILMCPVYVYTNDSIPASTITPRACTRGKVIGLSVVVVVVNKNIARSQHLGILASAQCDEDLTTGEKVTKFGSKSFDKGHECYKSYFCSATPINHTLVFH